MKNLKLNAMSLLNVTFGFLYFFSIAKLFGFSKESDVFLTAVTICTYISFVVAALWEGFLPFYSERKETQKAVAFNMLAVILVASALICFLTYVGSLLFISDAKLRETFSLLSVLIMTLNIQNFAKNLFSLQKKFEYFYIVDLSLNILLFIGTTFIYFYGETRVLLLVYTAIIAHIVVSLFFLLLLFKSNSFEASRLPAGLLKEILSASFKNKIGGLMYGAKEPVLAKLLLLFGDGVYSSYSYASKFLASVFAVAAAPQINVFSINALEAVKNIDKSFLMTISSLIANTLVKYLIFAVLVYFFAIFAFFTASISIDTKLFLSIYAALTLLYAVCCVEAPYARLLPAFKAFDEIVVANFAFMLFFCAGAYVAFLAKSIILTFLAVIFAQVFIAFIYYRTAKKRLNNWN